MPPRIRIRPRALRACTSHPPHSLSLPAIATYASVATPSATTPAPPFHQIFKDAPPILRYPATQPPSHKPPEVRKTQLHRQYQSLLRSSPLLLIFQHNNVKAVEWMSIRRELAVALRKLDVQREANGQETLAEEIKMQVIQTNIFASALRVVEFFNPEEAILDHAQHPRTNTSTRTAEDERFAHGLSTRAYGIANNRKLKLELEPLLSGPLAVVAFPNVAPQYLKTVLSILAPSKPGFPAPTRKANPDYYEASVQVGLQKLMLLGARVEGKVFDVDGTKWVGGIDGGIDGLRAQLVHMLQGVGGSLTSALEGASKSLYFTVEGRRMDMEEKEKGPLVEEEKKD
jgi:large subunit ribosomal protein L10